MRKIITKESIGGNDAWSIDTYGKKAFYTDMILPVMPDLVADIKEEIAKGTQFIAGDKHDDNGEAVIVVLFDEEVCHYTIDNCKDVFGRCEGEQVGFDRIEKIFDSIWKGFGFTTFDDLLKAMYGGNNAQVI